ncbi:hypothetical protein DH2020_012343 [Rehmannia glutinosa]|uniref:CONSTANS-like protein n=1 Tax=Rehmannia glutinosa TaxID=99300 RepID=A0ABR0X2H8_REHGL
MLKVENTTARDGGASATNSIWSRPCDTCCAAASTVYCRADSAYLCSACDANIHSANPLARRHNPTENPLNLYGQLAENSGGSIIGWSGEDEDEAASWLLRNPTIKNGDADQISSDEYGPLIGGEVDEYLDLDDYNSCQFNEGYIGNHDLQHYSVPQSSYGGDGVVPIQHQCFRLGLEYEVSNVEYSMSQSVSVSSMEVGVVPESTSEVSIYTTPLVQSPAQLSPIDREARVLRYREKKKNRKFEKTIRYASRKAYAETRPRIKGRFAKRKDVVIEADHMFSTSFMAESASYGLVPSF